MPSVKAMQKARKMIPEFDQHNSHLAWRGESIEALATAFDECDARLDEQARAFSDVAREALSKLGPSDYRQVAIINLLAPFVILEPAPDVLADALAALDGRFYSADGTVVDAANELRAEIARRGGLTIPGDAK